VKSPSEENAVMPQAVNRFGLMPKMDFEKPELEEIVIWLWNTYGSAPCGGRGKQAGLRRQGKWY